MKIIFSIARNEFRYLFYSPIAWFVLVIFLMQCGYFYASTIYTIANNQEISLEHVPSFNGFGALTHGVFLVDVFPNIIQNLFLVLPILTMGLMSREVNNGTSSLLYSSPVSIGRIVLGKYIGIMFYNMLLVLVIAIFCITAAFNIKDVDYGALLSALLGFYLLVGGYSAIGLFMSCLSNYQIISAVATLVTIFFLSYIGSLWQHYDLVRDLTWFLSLQDRTGNMLKGLIVTKDVFYFVLVTCMFLAFTYFKISNIMEFRPWYIRAARYITTISIVLVLGYISSRPPLTGYLDATASQRNTLAPQTQEVLKEFGDSTLEVTLYTNLFGAGLSRGLPEARNADYLANFWEKYLRFKPDIKFNYVYYYANDPIDDDSAFIKSFHGKPLDQIAAEYCFMYDFHPDLFKSASVIEPIDGLLAESPRLVMQLKYQGRTAYLRTFSDDKFWPDEKNSISVFKSVLGKPMPHIVYSTGSLERSIYKRGEREFSLHATSKNNRGSLLNQGYSFDTVNLNIQSIPKNIAALVIADPKMDLSSTVLDKLHQYITNGGNLMVYGEPGKQYVLNPLLATLGMQLQYGQLVYPSYDETPDKALSYLTLKGVALQKKMRQETYNIEDASRSSNLGKKDAIGRPMMMAGATTVKSLATTGWNSDIIATTIPNKSWLKMGPLVIDSIVPPFDTLAGDENRTSFPTVQQLFRAVNGKEQRVIITGDADFQGNLRSVQNMNFIYSTYSWMCDHKFPVFLTSIADRDILLAIGERTAYYQKIFFIWILPGIVLLFGTVLLVRRKRK